MVPRERDRAGSASRLAFAAEEAAADVELWRSSPLALWERRPICRHTLSRRDARTTRRRTAADRLDRADIAAASATGHALADVDDGAAGETSGQFGRRPRRIPHRPMPLFPSGPKHVEHTRLALKDRVRNRTD